MESKRIFSIRYFNFINIQIAKVLAGLLIITTLFRIYYFFNLPTEFSFEVLYAFVLGFRFDLMVLAFLIFPLLIFLEFMAITINWHSIVIVISKIYLFLISLLIISAWWMDFHLFSNESLHIHIKDLDIEQWLVPVLNSPDYAWSSISAVTLLVIAILMTKQEWKHWKDYTSPNRGSFVEAILRLVIPVVLTILAARGNLLPRHLNYDFSQFSEDQKINELSLNPFI